ncbi:MAG: hypothetical protein LUD48_01800 [Prevotella sp.]|nr:hypothetical protein [Prevotella sp.]
MKKYVLKWGLLSLFCALTTMAGAQTSENGGSYYDSESTEVEEVTITLVKPENLPTKLTELEAGYQIIVSTNAPEGSYLTLSIDDATTGENERVGYFNYDEETKNYVWENALKLTLYENNSYTFTVEARENQASGSKVYATSVIFTVEGSTEASHYSNIAFKSIDPDEKTILGNHQNTFTVTFTGKVKVDKEKSFINLGQTFTEPFQDITADSEYSDTWTFTISYSILEEHAGDFIALTIVAEDEAGYVLEGNKGGYQTYSFAVESDLSDFDLSVLPLNGATIEDLNTIIIGCDEGIDCSWSDEKGITITNEDGVVVAHSSKCIVDFPDAPWDPALTCTILFDANIVKEGRYMVTIPAGYFLLGAGHLKSPTITLIYYVGREASVDYEVTLSPENMEMVSSLSAITVMANGNLGFNEDYEGDISDIVVKNSTGEVVARAIDYDPIDDEETGYRIGYTFTLDETITAGGRYTYTIPAGFFCLGSIDNEVEELSAIVVVDGSESPDLKLTLDPADGSTVGSLSTIKVSGYLSFTWYHQLQEITLTDVNSGEVVATVADYEEEYESFKYDTAIILILSEEIADNGTYQLTIPEEMFMVGKNSEALSKEITATYKVDNTATGISNVFQNNSENGIYYNLNGQRVTSPRNGIYILNGKKVIVK